MATFKFGRDIDIHWNGYDIQGPAETIFSIPDQLYEEFNGDIAPVEPSLEWIDTNEFQTLADSVSGSLTLTGTSPINVSVSSNTSVISINSGTALNGYLLSANGSGGVIFAPASTSGLTSVVGIAPISTSISGGTVSVSIDTSAINSINAEVLRHSVKNTTGTTIPKGSAVYVSGATGDNALISLASASSEVTSSKTIGITAESIANDAFGYVIEAGYLTGIDTSATTAGAAVWLGNTPGSLVFVSPPAEPSHSVYLGVVVRVQSNNGSILVKVQNGYELNELHDVFVNSVSTALPLVYSSTSSGWVAQALSSVGIADDAVVTTKILDGAVTSAKIATGSINSTHIAANAVVAGDIAAAAVGSAALADNAVVAAKINAAAVGTAKIDATGGSSGWVLTANGSGGATFSAATGGTTISFTTVTAAYTLVLTDKDKMVLTDSGGPFNITIPPNSSVAFVVGSQIHVCQLNDGQNTIAAGAGVTVNGTPGLKLRTRYSSATLIQRSANTWVVVGDLAA